MPRRLRIALPLGLCLLAGCDQSSGTSAPQPKALAKLTPLPEYTGQIRQLLLHSKTGLVGQASKPVFDLLTAMPAKTRVTFLCDGADACRETRGRMKQYGLFDRLQIEVVSVEWAISVWARDRYIFCRPLDGRPVCLVPGLTGAVREPGRENERAHAEEIFRKLGIDARMIDTPLEGGNLLASPKNVFLGANSIQDGLSAHGSEQAAREAFARMFELPIVYVGDASGHVPFVHIDMYVSVVADDSIVVASPALGAAAMKDADAESQKGLRERLFEKAPDLSAARLKLFDDIVASLSAAGFKVSRMPYLDCLDGNFIITYNNVLQSEFEGKHFVYMPTYRIPALDHAARKAWEGLGCTVVPIDIAPISHLNGAIRCLANVIERG